MEPYIEVGILSRPEIAFTLETEYTCIGISLQGECRIWLNDDKSCMLQHQDSQYTLSFPVALIPVVPADAVFELKDVVIGIDFHWERKENQRFGGSLKFVAENGMLTAINHIALESYLKSVIASEMSAHSSPALLRTHAVISRSWLLSQIHQKQQGKKAFEKPTTSNGASEHIRWYDREDHLHYDVCADDHCQRYQGITRVARAEVLQAIDETHGEVLTFQGQICDARYSKCCGGVSELFENAWEPIAHPYLTRVVDNTYSPSGYEMDLTEEENAVAWIKQSPPAFCNTHDSTVLSQVLNDYDQETADFYRWETTLTQEEIQHLLKSRIGIDVGTVLALIPVERGVSGRLVRLRVVGTRGSTIIGKELEIRKAFSPSHLYSSAFVAEPREIEDEIPGLFYFYGAGWGHGVGLCQIGAAVMGSKGYSYRDILSHYFTGAEITRYY